MREGSGTRYCNYAAPLLSGEVDRSCINPDSILGMDTSRIDNLKYVDNSTVMYTSGNALCCMNVSESGVGKRRFLFDLDCRGIGCFALHPSGSIFAVGELGDSPNIYMYSYPELDLIRVLKKGTTRGYSCMAFSMNLSYLAGVGQGPDFLLTIWDWNNVKIELQCKAFSQDVLRVAFSLYDSGCLVTSGSGHIRFWKISKTFTGIKLEGKTGKFGKLEPSNVIAFTILPDGKVLSGNKFGDLLLWEGQFIKCRFIRPGGLPCHAQDVTSIHFHVESNTLVSACMGGWLRWWALEDVDIAEVDKFDNIDVEIDPFHELHAGSGVAIQCLEPGKGNFLIIDANGALRHLSMPVCTTAGQCTQYRALIKGTVCENSQVLELFHAGGIAAMDLSPSGDIVVTAGEDGTLRFWNFVAKRLLLSLGFSSAIQCLHWSSQSILFVGFADGTLRVLTFSIGTDGSPLSSVLHTTKPHESAISALSSSPCSGYLATGGVDQTIFLFNIVAAERSATVIDSFQLLPLGFVATCGVPLCLSWHSDSQHLLCALNVGGRGGVVELFIGDGVLESIETSTSYSISEIIQTREYKAITPRFSDLHDAESTVIAPCLAGCNQTTLNEERNTVPCNLARNTATSVSFRAKEGSDSGMQQNTQEMENIEEDVNFRYTYTPPVLSVLYQSGKGTSLGRSFLFTFGGWAAGYVFECDCDSDCPPQIVASPPPQPKSSVCTTSSVITPIPAIVYMQWCFHDRILVCGMDDGCMLLRSACESDMQGFGKVNSHTGGTSVTGRISYDGHWLVTAGTDGLVITHHLRPNDFLEKGNLALDTNISRSHCCHGTVDEKGNIFSSRLPSSPITVFGNDGGGAGATIDLSSSTSTDNVLEPKLNVTSCTSAPFETRENSRVVLMCNIPSQQHSLQQAKLNCVDENRQREAIAKKNSTCAVIESLRKEFNSLVKEGTGVLTSEQIQIDPFITKDLETKKYDMLAEIRLEMLPIEENIDRLLAELNERFLDRLKVETICMKAFNSVCTTMTFNTERLDLEAIQELQREFHMEEEEEEEEKNTCAGFSDDHGESKSGYKFLLEPFTSWDADLKNISEPVTPLSVMGRTRNNSTKASGYGTRKLNRNQCLASFEALKNIKPALNRDAPRDILAIEDARSTLGIYRLKTSLDSINNQPKPHYVQQLYGEKCLKIFSLIQDIYYSKLTFNEKFLHLRNRKAKVISNTSRDRTRVMSIDTVLSMMNSSYKPGSHIHELTLNRVEWPGLRTHVLAKERVLFEAKREKNISTSNPSASLPLIASTLDVATLIEEGLLTEDDAAPVLTNPVLGLSSAQFSPQLEVDNRIDRDDSIALILASKENELHEWAQTSAIGESGKDLRSAFLLEERQELVNRSIDRILAFDEALYDLQKARFKVAADIQVKELHLISLTRESKLLQPFVLKDRELSSAFKKYTINKDEVKQELDNCSKQLNEAKSTVGMCLEELSGIDHEFFSIFPSSCPFHEELYYIFKSKGDLISKTASNESSEKQEEDEHYLVEERSLLQDFGGSKIKAASDNCTENSCPTGCSMSLYRRVICLAKQYFDAESSLVDIKRTVAEYNRSREKYLKNFQDIEQKLAEIKHEMGCIQKETNDKLNSLPLFCPLTADQIYCFTSNDDIEDRIRGLDTVGPKLSLQCDPLTHVLFRTDSIKILQSRIRELEKEGTECKEAFKSLHSDRVRCRRECNNLKRVRDALQAKCNEVQMQKFGQIINLGLLDELNRNVQEANTWDPVVVMQATEANESSELLNEEVSRLQEDILKEISRNTALLQGIASVSKHNEAHKRGLTSPGSGSTRVTNEEEPSQSKETDNVQEKKVISLLRSQRKSIKAIRGELTALRKKSQLVC